jgi:hypothetical protein
MLSRGTLNERRGVEKMAKTFIINIEGLNDDSDSKKIENYFAENLKGIEDLKFDFSYQLVTVRYNEGIGTPKNILDAFERLGYPVR